MRSVALLFALLISVSVNAQKHAPMPHGMVYGLKPRPAATVKAINLETFMGAKTRVITTITGKVVKVTKQKGGWFDIDAGNGKIIAARFKDYRVIIPMALKGCTIIAEGVAEKQFIADASQHFAGDKQRSTKDKPKQSLTFEVTGLYVDK